MQSVLTDPSPQAINVAAEAMGAEALAFLTGLVGGEVHRDPDMVRFVMGVPVAWDNGVVGIRLRGEDLEVRLEETVRFFEARGIPWSWRVGSGSEPPELEKALVARRFCVVEDGPRMAVEVASMRRRPMPPELEILRVTDASSSKMWVDIINRGFGMKGAMANTVSAWARGARDDGRWVRFVGLVDGQPVSTSGVYLLGGVAGVAQVTTVPEFRRRGIGEAVTAAAVECARLAGYRIAVLGASPMARSMYGRMGFREVGRLKTLFPEGVGVAPRARMAGPSR